MSFLIKSLGSKLISPKFYNHQRVQGQFNNLLINDNVEW